MRPCLGCNHVVVEAQHLPATHDQLLLARDALRRVEPRANVVQRDATEVGGGASVVRGVICAELQAPRAAVEHAHENLLRGRHLRVK